MKRTFVSFDIFDTCLVRRCGIPSKIWDLMAETLFEKDDVRGKLSFVGNRSLAERKLNLLGVKFPSLQDIYESLNVEQWGFCIESLMQLEMDFEERELFPNPQVLSLMKKYRDKGFTIAFISDMYLPSIFLKRILKKFDFYKDGDLFFVSAECAAEKKDGALFDYVLKQTGTKAVQWVHHGDNKRSDFLVPKAKGVKAIFEKSTVFTEEENRWMSDSLFYSHKHEIQLWAGVCRKTRLENLSSEAASMAVDFIASCYIPFVIWVLRSAREKGIKKLFFLGRDGHIFYVIAKQFCYKYPEIEISYLKISRKAIYSGMFIEGSLIEFESTIGLSAGTSFAELLKKVSFDYQNLSEETKKNFPAGKRIFEKNRDDLFHHLLKNDKKNFVENSEQKRNLLLSYLKQEGALSEEKTAFVDLGWYGTCRCNLNYILKKCGFNTVTTFYWGAYDKLKYGSAEDELYVFQRQFAISCENHPFLNEFMEHYASMNSEGSTVGYQKKEKIVPLEEEPCLNDSEWANINEKCVISVCRNVPSTIESGWNDIFLCCGLKQLVCLYDCPTDNQVRFFSKLQVENYGAKNVFVKRLSLKNILALLVWGRPAESTWTSASINKTFGFLSPIFVKVYQSVSQSSLAMRLRLWWDGRK